MIVESLIVEFKASPRDIYKVFMSVLKRKDNKDEVNLVFLAYVVAEFCWQCFSDRASGVIGNLD